MNIVDPILFQCRQQPPVAAICVPGADISLISYRRLALFIHNISRRLAATGLRPGQLVAVSIENQIFHIAMLLALARLGMASVSARSAARSSLPVDGFITDKTLSAGVTDRVILADMSWTEGDGIPVDAPAVRPDDLCRVILTSGTTGEPKGVQHTHSSILYMLRSLNKVSPVSPGGRVVSFLPMAHIAERFISHYSSMAFGYSITTVADLKTLASVLPEVRPTRIFAVPRIYEKLHAALVGAIDAEADPVKQETTRDAIEIGLRKVRAEQAAEPVPDELLAAYVDADERVLSGLRAKIGFDQLEWPSVGAAPSSYSMLEFFHAIGVPIQELWGMSEILLVTINPPERVKLGTVGPAMPGVGLKLAPDGEVLISGGSLMLGYKGRDDLTAAAIRDGWMHTGDIGQLDGDGYLTIIDRKKELIINSAGKNMSPSKIEGELKQGSPLIGQAICIGDRRLYNVALITLDPDAGTAWANEHGLRGASVAALAADARVRAAVAEGVAAANQRLARVEQIKAFQLLDHEWLPGGDELTPTMKLKRKPIEHKYAAVIDALYASSAQ
jgi:long-chain acyl-CoA synthetase